MAVSELEQKFLDAEEKRKQAEERRLNPPLPPPDLTPLQQSYARIKEEVELIGKKIDLVNLADNSVKFEQLNQNLDGLADVAALLRGLHQKLDGELERQKRQRELERETLVKLNRYLDDWSRR